MAPDTSDRDGEAELAAIPLLGDQIDPGGAEPVDSKILELVADGEDPKRLAAEVRAVGIPSRESQAPELSRQC